MQKNYTPLIATIIFALGILIAWYETSFFSPPPAESVLFTTMVITAPKGTIVADLADTEAKQEIGLTKYQSLPQGRGMLFTYNYSQASGLSIWMKGKNFPMDIIWLNADKAVTLVKADISPKTYQETEARSFNSIDPSPYVLELPAGEAKRLGIAEGINLSFNFVPEEDTTTPLTYQTTLVTAPNGKITAEIANPDEAVKYTRGLGYRQNLPEGRGMIFVLKVPSEESIWMKGMNFPIDIIWLNPDKKVTTVKANVSPGSYGKTESSIYFSANPDTLYVLELPAGNAAKYGIQKGATLSFDLPQPVLIHH